MPEAIFGDFQPTIGHADAELARSLQAACQQVQVALDRGTAATVPDAAIQALVTAAVKLYAARADGSMHELRPFQTGSVSPTEVAVAVCAMVRDADLNLLDLAMWFNRPTSFQ